MTHYYLATYVGAGTDADPFRPSGADLVDSWGAIDLRPEQTRQEGRCLLAVPEQLPTASGRFHLGDDLDGPSAALRRGVESRLGVTLADSALRRIVRSLLVEHGDDGRADRWNTLKAGVDRRYRIFLAGLIDQFAVVGGGATLTDSFDRADNTDINASAPVTWTEVLNDSQINTNRVSNVTTGTTGCRIRCESDLSGADHYAKTTSLRTVTDTTGRAGVIVRYSSIADTGYLCDIRQDGSTWRIASIVAGVVTDLTTGTPGSTPNAKPLELSVNGSSLSALFNNVDALNVTDVVITGNTRAGGRFVGPGGANRAGLGDWEAGDLTAGQPYKHRRTYIPHARIGRGGPVRIGG